MDAHAREFGWRSIVREALVIVCGALLGGLACQTSSVNQLDGGSGGVAGAGDVDPDPHTVPPDGGSDAESGAFEVGESGELGEGRTSGAIWEPEAGEFVLRDRQTGSLWNMRGEAYAGPLRGATLDQVPAFNSFWFAWSRFYDGSLIWRARADDIRNQTSAIDVDSMSLGCPGKDCIPALDYAARPLAGKPRPRSASMVRPDGRGTNYLDPRELVAGVVVDGQARAYPLNVYAHHEIHNDRIGDREFSMTFCPLTGSAIPFDGTHEGEAIRYGVSGRLLHANLVMFDPQSDTFWSQMIGEGVKGPGKGDRLDRMPVVETTWARWKEMYPKTLVTSAKTGYNRDYNDYPYGGYRTDDANTWNVTDYQKTYEAKKRVLGLPAKNATRAKAFPFPELEKLEGDRNVVHSTFRGKPIVVVWESEFQMAVPYWRTIEVDGEERELTFEGTVAK